MVDHAFLQEGRKVRGSVIEAVDPRHGILVCVLLPCLFAIWCHRDRFRLSHSGRWMEGASKSPATSLHDARPPLLTLARDIIGLHKYDATDVARAGCQPQ